MFVYSKGICSSRGVQVSRGVENDKMKQLIVLGMVMKTSQQSTHFNIYTYICR